MSQDIKSWSSSWRKRPCTDLTHMEEPFWCPHIYGQMMSSDQELVSDFISSTDTFHPEFELWIFHLNLLDSNSLLLMSRATEAEAHGKCSVWDYSQKKHDFTKANQIKWTSWLKKNEWIICCEFVIWDQESQRRQRMKHLTGTLNGRAGALNYSHASHVHMYHSCGVRR